MRELRGSKAYACSNSDLGEVLFHDVMFWDSKYRTFERDFSCFLRWNFLRFGGAFKLFVPYLVPVNEKIS